MTVDFRYPLLDVAGPPRQRGESYGQQAADRIAANIEHYRWVFQRDRGLTWQEVLAGARDLLPSLEQYDADAVDELHGIAAGADVSVESLVALNCRTELLHGLGECTVASVLPERSVDGHTLTVQNWDWLCGSAETAVLLRSTTEDGLTVVSLHEAGYLARGGYNSAGVAALGNFLMTEEDRRHTGMPLPFIGRRILLGTSVGAAAGALLNAPRRTVSTNVVITGADGIAVDLEATPTWEHWVQPRDGLLVHSNHFQTPGVRDTGKRHVPDSLHRDVRLRTLLEAAEGGIDVATIQAAMQDHAGWPFGICRHPSPGPSGLSDRTLASMIVDLTTGELWLADGNPCERAYAAFGRLAHELPHAASSGSVVAS